jgi:hypothetical protein
MVAIKATIRCRRICNKRVFERTKYGRLKNRSIWLVLPAKVQHQISKCEEMVEVHLPAPKRYNGVGNLRRFENTNSRHAKPDEKENEFRKKWSILLKTYSQTVEIHRQRKHPQQEVVLTGQAMTMCQLSTRWLMFDGLWSDRISIIVQEHQLEKR